MTTPGNDFPDEQTKHGNLGHNAEEAPSKKRSNAFAELMSTAKKPKPELEKAKNILKGLDPRNGLGAYISAPETNPDGRIVEYDDDFVVIRDKYPKASVHLLLIPRKKAYYNEHPLHLLSNDAAFLQDIRTRVARLKRLAATELRRLYGVHSASDAPYHTALESLMESPTPPTSDQLAALPAGRDWESEIIAGVHTHPSMNHMHIHVLSREMYSPCVKHKKHYLSFHSSFLAQVDEFPLEKGSARYKPGDWPNWDMTCWRCGKNFGNKFAKLNKHLKEEFDEWKRE
ncbi:HIT-like domain-containing protein [Phaeosphaeriaceae sp. PMI808]|nr:HIT-like domain-containing protein [Phaeosphaeriaceae sp. PMI808]